MLCCFVLLYLVLFRAGVLCAPFVLCFCLFCSVLFRLRCAGLCCAGLCCEVLWCAALIVLCVLC